jgi:hypothetical protein
MGRASGHLLCNETATSAPRQGWLGVLGVGQLTAADASGEGASSNGQLYLTPLVIAVQCPNCTNYARITGEGNEYRNITKMLDPRFACSVCSWGPKPGDSPEQWQAYYAGRLGGTLVWAANEEHMDVLVRYLEAPPQRRKRVEFGWEYRSLMNRLPHEITSGRARHDMVSLIKRLQRTRPRGV